MADWTLIVGNKNYSSWSLRGYLAVARAGVAFDEVVIPLDQPDSKRRLLEHSPTGLVPVLRAGDDVVFDSLAIAEYVAERFPAAGLWPEDPALRAQARSVAAEMHSGFAPLRANMPMDMRNELPGRGRTPEVLANIDRIAAVWRERRGKFLFGDQVTIPDIMYAPVVSRFRTYGVDLDERCAAYSDAVWEYELLQQWFHAAREESWIIE